MNFDFSQEEEDFIKEVRNFIKEEKLKDNAEIVFAPNREADATTKVDSAPRRAFMKELAKKGYLGMSWPKKYGGQEKDGIYDYLLNEELATVGAPAPGKGGGSLGLTIIRHCSEKLKKEFLPQILNADIEFALGYSEPGAGSDLASLKLKAEKKEGGWLINGQKTWTSSAHFAEWYWLAARTGPDQPKHKGISVFLVPMDDPGIEVHPIETMGDQSGSNRGLDSTGEHASPIFIFSKTWITGVWLRSNP